MKKKIFEFVKNYNMKYSYALAISSVFAYALAYVGKMEDYLITASGLLSVIFVGFVAVMLSAKEKVAKYEKDTY